MNISLEETCASIAAAMATDPDPFAQRVSEYITATLAVHSAWTGACQGGSSVHDQDGLPWEEFEHAFSIAVTWMLARNGAREVATS